MLLPTPMHHTSTSKGCARFAIRGQTSRAASAWNHCAQEAAFTAVERGPGQHFTRFSCWRAVHQVLQHCTAVISCVSSIDACISLWRRHAAALRVWLALVGGRGCLSPVHSHRAGCLWLLRFPLPCIGSHSVYRLLSVARLP
jgi:hypothetical protein